ncbi:stigma-specific STIG1-like protein 1 [Mercurialis annua]|uniref:stigma-specific STIG1-like protein 1 n=1 Tax=Mercurialis annua TaxID=3986 RepID=UPI00215F4917|nr:stigma-specific STIG1-like protein 1 [Mercurialis annua]
MLCTYLLIILLLSIPTSHHDRRIIGARELTRMREYSDAPQHLNFLRSTTLRGRQRVISCANDAEVCLDREKNPWGGTTCCFRKVCRDTLRDSRNCGACGKTCGFGFVCCDGKCVDIQNDPKHCGACFEVCRADQGSHMSRKLELISQLEKRLDIA